MLRCCGYCHDAGRLIAGCASAQSSRTSPRKSSRINRTRSTYRHSPQPRSRRLSVIRRLRVDAFKAALAANDLAAFAKLLGLDAEKLKADENTVSTFAQIRKARPSKWSSRTWRTASCFNSATNCGRFHFHWSRARTANGLSTHLRGSKRSSIDALARTSSRRSTPCANTSMRSASMHAGPGRRRRAGVCAKADQQRRPDRRPLLAGRPRRWRQPRRGLRRRGCPGEGKDRVRDISVTGSAS